MGNIGIEDFRNIVPLIWSKETCYEPWQNDWTQENPAKGQCFVTAKLFQDLFGGDLLKAKDENNNSHYWNLLDGVEYDFTKSQYKNDEKFTKKEIVLESKNNPRVDLLKINLYKKVL